MTEKNRDNPSLESDLYSVRQDLSQELSEAQARIQELEKHIQRIEANEYYKETMPIKAQELEKPVDGGKLWSEIRAAVTYCRDDIKGAAEAQSYERESAYLDGMARTIADRLLPKG
jgi:hypothetical protein